MFVIKKAALWLVLGRVSFVLVLVMSGAHFAIADGQSKCREQFAEYFVDRTKLMGVKIHVTQAIKGGPTTENWNYQAAPGHWMSEAIKPSGLPWSLVHNNTMFSSRDKGKSWQKIRTLDSAQRAEDVAANLKATLATVTDVACGTEELNGVPHRKLSASYKMLKYATEHRDTYWIKSDSGWMTKAITSTKGKGYQMSVTQRIEPAPKLKLPTP